METRLVVKRRRAGQGRCTWIEGAAGVDTRWIGVFPAAMRQEPSCQCGWCCVRWPSAVSSCGWAAVGSSTNFRLGFLYRAGARWLPNGRPVRYVRACGARRCNTLQVPDAGFQVPLRTVSVLRPVSDVAMIRN